MPGLPPSHHGGGFGESSRADVQLDLQKSLNAEPGSSRLPREMRLDAESGSFASLG